MIKSFQGLLRLELQCFIQRFSSCYTNKTLKALLHAYQIKKMKQLCSSPLCRLKIYQQIHWKDCAEHALTMNSPLTQSIFTPLGGSRKQLAYSPSQLQKCSRIYFFAMDSRIPRCRPTGVGQCSDFNWQNFQQFCKGGGIFQKFMAPGPSATNGLSEEHLNSKT